MSFKQELEALHMTFKDVDWCWEDQCREAIEKGELQDFIKEFYRYISLTNRAIKKEIKDYARKSWRDAEDQKLIHSKAKK